MSKRSNDKWLSARMAKVKSEAKANAAAQRLASQFRDRYPPEKCPVVGIAGCINRADGSPSAKLVVYARTKKQEKELRALKDEVNPAEGGLRITYTATPGFFTFENVEVEIKYLGKIVPGSEDGVSFVG